MPAQGRMRTTRPSRPNPSPDLDLMYRIARARLDWQLQFLDSHDAKLGLFLAVGTGVIAIAAALVTIHFKPLGIAALAVAIGAYGSLVWYTLVGLRVTKWATGPEIDAVARGLRLHGEYEAERR